MGDGAREDLMDRIDADDRDLRAHGVITRAMWSGDDGRLVVEVIAPDLDTAARVMSARYGEAVTVDYLGPDETASEPIPWRGYRLEAADLVRVFFKRTALARWLDRVEVTETADSVTVTVFEGYSVGGSEKMPGVPEQGEVVALQRTLGGRPVLDGSRPLDAPRGTLPP
jgi:hypothetical protein